MTNVSAALVAILLLVGGVLLVIGFFEFIRAITSPLGNASQASSNDDLDGMDEGDYHNGPGGYSAGSSYRDSYYGGGHDGDHE